MPDEAGRASPLEQAVFDLQDKLREAACLEGRPGAIDALLAVMEFLSLISAPGELLHLRPISALVSALMSLNDGEVLPLLEPVRRSGRARNSVAKEGAKAMAVFVVKRLAGMGLDPNLACERVARVCRQAGVRPGRKGGENQIGTETTARTVRKWCDDISADVGCHSRAGRHFRLMSGVEPFLHGNTTRDALLEALRRYLTDTSTA
jgi:hypothetical protein